MVQYQITRWQSLPSLVVAKEGEELVKVSLHTRLQEAIDEAAMRLGATDADAYMNGWNKSEWIEAEGTPAEVADRVARGLEDELSESAIAAFLEGLGQ